MGFGWATVGSSGPLVLSAETTYATCGKDDDMQSLTIEAVTPDTAFALRDALSEFRAELRVTVDGRSYVEVTLGQSDLEIVEVLNAIEDYVTQRAAGSAGRERVALNGRKYALHVVPPLS
jgi:hypothetical protein